MDDSSDDYDRMPIERVDLILAQLWPEYWTPRRLLSASPSEKREAVRNAFTGRGRRRAPVGKGPRPAYRAATDPVNKTFSSENGPSKSDMMSDLPSRGSTLGGEPTNQLSAKLTAGGGYDYGDLDPGIIADAKAAAIRIRRLTVEMAQATVPFEIRIGRELLAVKARLGHGHFGPWLAAEFGWSDRQARRFMRAAQGAAQGKGTYTGPRDEDVDAYMTDPSVGEQLVAVMRTKIAEQGIPADDLWWVEPCAGSGNILQHMPPDRRLGIDINPLASGIVQADFLSYELDPTVRWVALTNPSFYDDGPTRIFNRAAAQNVQAIGLVLPAYLRPDKAQWVNGLDPFYECIHDELLPKESFLRNGKPHDVPARFQIWVRRDTRREPLKERTEHPDLIWVPKSRSDEATIWICRRGPDIGNIIEATGITLPPEGYYGIRCSVDTVAILRSIRWRDVLDPLPVSHPPNMSRTDIVRLYVEAAETAHDADDDHTIAFGNSIAADITKPEAAEELTGRALTTECVAEPDSSWEPIEPFLHYGLDVEPDQPASSVIPSTSPEYGESRKSSDRGVPSVEWVSSWADRVEQFKRVLRPDDGALIAYLKEEVVDDQRSSYVLELRLTMRPTPTGPHNFLFMSGCCTSIA
jgi:hypothetical protein